VGGGITDTADVVAGMFRVFVGTMPDEADRVVAAIVDQVRAMHTGSFSDDEVDCARRYLAGSWVFDFQTVEQRVERLLELERGGRARGGAGPVAGARGAGAACASAPGRPRASRPVGPGPRRVRADSPP